MEDLAYWKPYGTPSDLMKISALIASMENDPFTGIGKPEKLKYDLTGKWSRRINLKDRIIYRVTLSSGRII
ncbi:MAG: Txe/YoeB family addiction module toxin [Tannerella sp.]|nr:Txe/YoeB family addiction module toxin [Tannerella sp.]